MSTDAEVVQAARTCTALHHAHLVAGWVGDGVGVTDDGLPAEADVPGLARALDVAVPASDSSTVDVPELFRAWVVALDRDLIAFSSEGHVTTGSGVVYWASIDDDELLEHWTHALVCAVAATLGIEDDDAAVLLCVSALDAVEEHQGPATALQLGTAIENRFREDYEGFADDTDDEAVALRRESSQALLAEFTAFGVLDEALNMTALGVWALGELDSWDGDDSDMLGELADMLLAEGVDPNDETAVQSLMEQLVGEPSTLEDSDDEQNGDFRTLDLKETFDLPDALPPLSMPDIEELADAARNSELLADTAESDDAAVLRIWSQVFYDLLSEDVFQPDDAPQDEDSELDFDGLGTILAVLLFLGRNSGVALDELDDVTRESSSVHLEPEHAERAWQSWISAHGNPVRVFLDKLIAHGAASYDAQAAQLSPLGLHAVRERMRDCDVEVPILPPIERMNAGEFISLVEHGDEQELADFSSAWLAAHEPDVAADELLSIAADGGPVRRIIATAIVNEIQPAPTGRWQAMLETPSVRPYAKIALTRIAELDPEDAGELEPSDEDLGWLLADTLSSTMDALDEEELAEEIEQLVTPAVELEGLFEGVRRCAHPYGHEVLNAIGTHHPDATTAKAARIAASRTSSGDQ